MPFLKSFWIRSKTGFLTHDCSYRYASKSIKGFIDAYFDLVFNKTLSQKNGSMGWGPGLAKGGQNFQNMPSLWCHLQKTPTEKRFSSMSTRRLAESVEDSNSSLALAAGDLWPKKGRPIVTIEGSSYFSPKYWEFFLPHLTIVFCLNFCSNYTNKG